ncbi:hypothetical protein FC07_GL002921 [Loigolactobacillus bifermentans DSM 20003]|uniref:Uncharacterized protein n=2 Tax=Loigolactobacillus bifermentans TaxID=1607 RepID=A0A0R1GSF3_9LACO|nr:hypothetical protein FC07_GL002921 [Loigolactobacillus bifermentans DSM 20003]
MNKGDASMRQVAGTILMIDAVKEPHFLVAQKGADQYRLLLTADTADHTPLANILQTIKTKLSLDVSDLRLSELTNVSVEARNMSLFIFEWANRLAPTKQQAYIEQLATQGYFFKAPRELRGLLDRIEVTGVPNLNPSK